MHLTGLSNCNMYTITCIYNIHTHTWKGAISIYTYNAHTHRFAFERAEPPIDPSQNIYNASAVHVDGVTTITFNRPRNSGDNLDISLDECRFFLFAFGGQAFFFATPPIAIYHGSGPTRRAASAERICIPTVTECSAGKFTTVLLLPLSYIL